MLDAETWQEIDTETNRREVEQMPDSILPEAEEEPLRINLLTGSEYVHKFYYTITKDYYLIPGNGTIKLVDHIYEWIWIKTPIQIYDSLPKDYCLIPSNATIKLDCRFP